MQVVVQDSNNANERAILIEGWNKLDPPTPIDISAVTLRVSNNGGTVANADGTITRLDSSHVHRFVFADAAQFRAFAAGDVVALIVPDSATGDGRMGLSFPILVSAGNPGAAPQTVPTAEDNANAVVAEASSIASAVLTAATATPIAGNVTQIAGQTASAVAAVTFPATVASTTNITAGTITTATNVTTVNGLAANVITASALAADAATEIANAVVEAEIDALETYNRTTNTAATITGPTNGATTLTITTDASYLPIKSIT